MKVAVVILNWNGRNWLEQFLPNVVQHSSTDATIVVADNGSTDDSVDWVKAHHPEVEIVLNSENYGFAGGYNAALQQVEADYYMLLNSDVEVTANWLKPLIEVLDNQPDVAAVMPKVRSFHKRDYFEHAGACGGFIDKNSYPFCRGRLFDEVEQDQGQYDTPRAVAWTTGAAMLIRAARFHETAGFDADFFAHMEEIDLCWRLKNQGYGLMCIPESVVYHVGGGALPYSSPRKTRLNFRNNLFMIVKNYRGSSLFFYTLNRLMLDGIAAAKFLFSGKFSHFGAVFKAHMQFYGKLGIMRRKRKALKPTLSVNPDRTGFYKKNLLVQFFFKGKKKFSAFERSDFN